MIKKIGIENFRVFKNYTEFELAPINILTGPNNSGKSSLIKFLGLIKKSFAEEFGINRLIFEGGNHNLGTFENILNWNKKSKQLKLTFDFPLNHFDEKFQIELVYILHDKSEDAQLTSIRVFNQKRELFKVFASFKDSDFDIVEEDNDFYGFYSIDIQYLKKFLAPKKELFFNYYKMNNGKKEFINKKYKDLFLAFEDVFSTLIIDFDPDDGDLRWYILTDYLEFILKVEYNHLSYFLKDLNLKDSGKNINVWNRVVNSYLKKNKLNKEAIPQFNLLEMKHFLEELEDIKIGIDNDVQSTVDKLIKNNFGHAIKKLLYTIDGIDHLTAIRGNQKRGFSNPEGNNIDAIVKEYYSMNYNYRNSFLAKCFDILGIKGKLEIERKEGVISFVYLKNRNKKTLIADLGFGYSQIIPIILKIDLMGKIKGEEWYGKNPYNPEDLPKREPTKKEIEEARDLLRKDKLEDNFDNEELKLFALNLSQDLHRLDDDSKYSILIIEEPEANLHPNLQSKLADIFVLAQQEYNIKFIIETHSEYLIRKLQYLTANNDIESGKVKISYFNEDKYVNESEPKMKSITINEFGGLTDSFGPGFFDEATHLQFELLKLNKGQSN